MKTVQLVLRTLLLSSDACNPLQSISACDVSGDLPPRRNYHNNNFK